MRLFVVIHVEGAPVNIDTVLYENCIRLSSLQNHHYLHVIPTLSISSVWFLSGAFFNKKSALFLPMAFIVSDPPSVKPEMKDAVHQVQ